MVIVSGDSGDTLIKRLQKLEDYYKKDNLYWDYDWSALLYEL